jgi:hypothetical protein
MELFPAGDQDQWTLIQQVIDDCDYYLLIIGGRYGSIGNGGLSYAEMEYRYALRSRKPVIAFLHRNPEKLPDAKREKTTIGLKRLQAFRTLAQQKLVRFWSKAADLNAVVSRSLVSLIAESPSAGWVRADSLAASHQMVTRSAFFQDFHDLFPALIENSTRMTLFFIHSRRWRENHDDSLKRFLIRPRAKLIIFLPDLKHDLLIQSLEKHFEDGPSLRHLITDAYRYFANLFFNYPNRVEIRLFTLYPTYSFYKFDKRLIMAMYPTTIRKKNVPTFEIETGTKYWKFVLDDVESLTAQSKPLTHRKIHALLKSP